MRKFFAIFLFTASCAFGITKEDVDATLKRLDFVLSKQQTYLEKRQAYIDSLCTALPDKPDGRLLMRISEAYKGYDNDSAMTYLWRAIENAGPEGTAPYRWRLAALMPLAGLFDKAVNTYSSVSADSIDAADLPSYYDCGRQMYSYIGAFFKDYPDMAAQEMEKSLAIQRKLLEVLPAGTIEHKFNYGEYFYLTGSYDRAALLLAEVMEQEPVESNLRARAAHHLSTISRMRGDETAAVYYLTLSAISDVISATREVASLQELGNTLYSHGHIARAHNYLSAALEKAVTCGAPLRMVEASRGLPIIEHAYSSRLAESRRSLYWLVAGLVVLLCVLLLTLVVLRKEMVKMGRLQNSLRDANSAKEIYISQFLNLSSIYMDKLSQFNKIVMRKIATGQADDLLRMTRSGKFVDEQSKEFYEVFDNAFLHIYPNFVEDVNELFRPECRITLKSNEMLNSDLRILALVRLGIEDNNRIAQVLNFSLNTIYSYRNRLRNRAIDRETFERDIMRISSRI